MDLLWIALLYINIKQKFNCKFQIDVLFNVLMLKEFMHSFCQMRWTFHENMFAVLRENIMGQRPSRLTVYCYIHFLTTGQFPVLEFRII